MQLVWDQTGERFYETGVDHGVLYLPDASGAYNDGVAWNGLTTVTESPSGAEPNAQYADNIKYLNLFSAEEFSATIEAYTYPPEFDQFDGLGVPSPGVTVGQQIRGLFGLCYRTRMGNDIEGNELGYKLHLVYGCKASPSEKAYASVNDSPEAINFSWAISTTPVPVPGMKPTSIITVDSTKVNATALADLERILYGDVGVDPALPLPGSVIALFGGTITTVTPPQPAFDAPSNTITIPTVPGVTYYINGVAVPAGPVVITEDTVVTARPNDGYVFAPGVDDDWFYNFA
jgi:hypothetical protein